MRQGGGLRLPLLTMQIEFITFGSVPGLGGFAPGTLARVSPQVAAQLVDGVRCARYVEPAEPAPTAAKRTKRVAAQRANTESPK
jgi:hypothetical protein